MTTTTLAAAILRDVPRHSGCEVIRPVTVIYEHEVLAVLTAAMDPALSERAGEVVERLQAEKSVVSTTRTFPSGDERDMVLVPHYGPNPLANAAADLITALLTANAALRVERDALATEVKQADAMLVAEANASLERLARADAAEAVAEKLRAERNTAVQFLREAVHDLKLEERDDTSARGKELIDFLAALTTEES